MFIIVLCLKILFVNGNEGRHNWTQSCYGGSCTYVITTRTSPHWFLAKDGRTDINRRLSILLGIRTWWMMKVPMRLDSRRKIEEYNARAVEAYFRRYYHSCHCYFLCISSPLPMCSLAFSSSHLIYFFLVGNLCPAATKGTYIDHSQPDRRWRGDVAED